LVQVVLGDNSNELTRTVANRVFASDDDGASGSAAPDEISSALVVAHPDLLSSHAITVEAARHLRDGNAEAFLEARRASLTDVVAAFVDSRAEWDRKPRRPIAQMTLMPNVE
jgi:hypothetical protein